MPFKDVIGQEHITGHFQRAIGQGRLAHAYIFYGPAGIGKAFFAKQLAKRLHCANPVDDDACDACNNCLNIENNAFPLVQSIGLRESAQKVKIEDILALEKRLSLKTFSKNQYNVVIINDAEELSLQAYNALLKTIEEPPDSIVIILVTSNIESLPLTVVSRCQVINFRSLKHHLVSSYLQKNKKLSLGDADFLAGFTNGSIGYALELFSAGVLAERDWLIAMFRDEPEADWPALLFERMNKPSGRKNAQQDRRHLQIYISVLLSMLSDSFAIKLDFSRKQLYNQALAQDVFPRVTADKLLEKMQALSEADELIWKNVNLRLASTYVTMMF
ncbi:MAG: DNA polymerase III subunit [Planctomycetes bacterium]|nr:DNA polymerase III subunit [Planctomycetota bacterium]